MRRVIIARWRGCYTPRTAASASVAGPGDPSRGRGGVIPSARDPMAADTIRCPDCGRRAPASETVCPGCRSSLQQLCECGATAHLAETTCASCGVTLIPPEYRRRPMALRIVAIVVLVGLVVTAGKEVGFKVPVVVRLEGTNVEKAKKMLAEAKGALPTLIAASDLTDAAKKVCAQVA